MLLDFLSTCRKRKLPLKLSEYEKKINKNFPRSPQHWPKLCHAHCQPVTAARNGTVLLHFVWNFAHLLGMEPHSPVGSQARDVMLRKGVGVYLDKG